MKEFVSTQVTWENGQNATLTITKRDKETVPNFKDSAGKRQLCYGIHFVDSDALGGSVVEVQGCGGIFLVIQVYKVDAVTKDPLAFAEYEISTYAGKVYSAISQTRCQRRRLLCWFRCRGAGGW